MKVYTMEDMLLQSKKSLKHYKQETNGDFLELHIQNILNMRTVKEGTAKAGSFCNKIMEIAYNNGYNRVVSRTVSDIFQRIALDAKHSKGNGGYKSADWFQLAELMNKADKKEKYEDIETKVFNILNSCQTEEDFNNIDDDFLSDDDF